MTFDLDWAVDTTFTSDSLNFKTEEKELAGLSLPDLSQLPARGSIDSACVDSPPSMADSFLSLEFGSPSEIASVHDSGFCMSGAYSEPFSVDSRKQTLFSPLETDAMLPSKLASFAKPAPTPCCATMHGNSALHPCASADFTLFPKEEETAMHSTVFRSSLDPGADSNLVFALLNRLNGCPASTNTAKAPLGTAAPHDLSSPALVDDATSALDMAEKHAVHASHNARKRRNVEDLLPIDAPVQPRNYRTESATSRRIFAKSEAGSPDPASSTSSLDSSQDVDARSLKRLSNTLAARRSRHRKAEELKRLHDHIAELQNEVATWKQRCESAEKERDRAKLCYTAT